MSAIQEMLRYTIKKIRDKQNFFTAEDRKEALRILENNLDKDYSDEQLYNFAKQQREWIFENGFFGIRGKSGSNFLKEMDDFIHCADYILTSQKEFPGTTIKLLAQKTLDDLKANNLAPFSTTRSFTILKLHLFVNKSNVTDEKFIEVAEKQKEFVINFKQRNDKIANYFINKLTSFIGHAKNLFDYFSKLPSASQPDVEVKPVPPSNEPITSIVAADRAKQKAADLARENYDAANKKRWLLEDEIAQLLGTVFDKEYPAIKIAWVHRDHSVNNFMLAPNSDAFFKIYQKQLNSLNDSATHQALKQKLAEYLNLVNDKEYLTYRLDLPIESEKESIRERLEVTKKKELEQLAEEKEEAPATHYYSDLFQDKKYALYQSAATEDVQAGEQPILPSSYTSKRSSV